MHGIKICKKKFPEILPVFRSSEKAYLESFLKSQFFPSSHKPAPIYICVLFLIVLHCSRSLHRHFSHNERHDQLAYSCLLSNISTYTPASFFSAFLALVWHFSYEKKEGSHKENVHMSISGSRRREKIKGISVLYLYSYPKIGGKQMKFFALLFHKKYKWQYSNHRFLALIMQEKNASN